MSSPIEVFHAVVAALDAEDWHAAAALFDPASLTSFKRQLLERLAPADAPAVLTADHFMRMQPDLPRTVAEYYAAMHAKRPDPASILEDEVPGIESADELETLSPPQVFAAHLSAQAIDRQIDRVARQSRLDQKVVDRIRATPWPKWRYLALGAVPDGDDVAFVVYRREYQMAEFGQAQAEAVAEESRLPTSSSSSPSSQSNSSVDGHDSKSTHDHVPSLPIPHPEIVACRRQPNGKWRLIADYGALGRGIWGIGVDGVAGAVEG